MRQMKAIFGLPWGGVIPSAVKLTANTTKHSMAFRWIMPSITSSTTISVHTLCLGIHQAVCYREYLPISQSTRISLFKRWTIPYHTNVYSIVAMFWRRPLRCVHDRQLKQTRPKMTWKHAAGGIRLSNSIAMVHLCVAFVASITVASTQAELSLPMVLGDHMVLQREVNVSIWGTADHGADVSVRFGDQARHATADASGRWRIELDPMPASFEPRILRVESGGQIVERVDVLVGEVWLCAGQSNMQMGLARAADGEAEVAEARDPMVRLLRVENHVVPRGKDAVGEWMECSPESARRFSAVGYYFGTRLREELDVPVGLICSAWGATGIESWTPIEAIRDEPVFASVLQRDRKREADRPRLEAEYATTIDRWRVQCDTANASGEPLPKQPRLPMALRPQSQTGSLYDAMILPLAPYAIRGALWYQGESNVGQGAGYTVKLTTLISAWRQSWAQNRFYFGIVQLPNYHPIASEPGDSDWARLREAQRLTAQQVPDTGLIVTIDLGDPDNGHPKNKRDIGERLIQWALGDVYNKPIAGHGPIYQRVTFVNGSAELTFTDGFGELKAADGKPLQSFVIAGMDQQWHWAQADVVGPHKLRVWSTEVAEPVAVRYAWFDNPPSPNLTDDSSLPASPFRTDNWPKQ